MLVLGETYLIEGLGPKAHVWVVCSLPSSDGSVLLINMTTARADSDRNCVINEGEHSFVKHETVMEYEKARIISKEGQAAIYGMPAKCPRKGPVSLTLLTRIQEGALSSDLTTGKHKTIIKDSIAKQAKDALAQQPP